MSADEHDDERRESCPDSGDLSLTFNEARVLGCLLEKEATTPDYYPLSLNSLHSACNQSSNRDPVTDLGTGEIEEALEGLRYKSLALLVRQAGARVPKSKHTLEKEFPYLTEAQSALLCVLLLRGRQTAGELRQRTERIHPFSDIDAVEKSLQELIENKPSPLVKRIPAGGGRRVETFVQLLCTDEMLGEDSDEPAVSSKETRSAAAPGRIEEMELEIAELQTTVQTLLADLDHVKRELGIESSP